MKKPITLLLVILLVKTGFAQIDPDLLRSPDRDSTRIKLNMDAVYDRPFLQAAKLPVALGGYAEA
ncbi:MAG: hypothetical protein Q7U83_01385, partial [Daejeonella sp.]|nr:hypothetical protein [Daejeonella sp.]